MSGFFDFIKNNNSNASPSTTSPLPGVPPQPGVVTQQQVVTQPQTGSYNGIGNPPGGQAYNGIGAPPQKVLSPEQQRIQQLLQTQQPVGNPGVPQTKSAVPQQPAVPPTSQPVQPGQSAKPLGSSLNSTMNTQKRTDLDLMTHLTQRSNRVFVTAQAKAKELGSAFIDSEHMLHGLLADGEIYKLLMEMKVQPQQIEAELAQTYKREQPKAVPPQMSPRLKRIIDNSLVIARKLGFEFISPEHILFALYEEGEGIGARALAKLGLKKEELNKKITGNKEGLLTDQKEAEKKKSSLEQFTIDITARAAQGLLDPVIERSQVIERVIHILSRRSKNNPAMVGEAGVGKTAIIEGLAQQIVNKQVPEPLLNKRILGLDLMSVMAGASHKGEFEERMKGVIDEVKASKGQIILFIDEIHNIVAGGEGSGDAGNLLKPALSRGEMQLIGATTLTEYRKYIEKDPALERRFQPVVVPEPTEEQAIKMLKALKGKYEAFHRVQIPDDAVEAAVRLSKRYVGERFLPDKAIDLIDESASAVRLPLISLPEEIKSIEERIKQLQQESVESTKSGDNVRVRIIKSKLSDIEADLNQKKDEFNTKKAQTTTSVTVAMIKDIVSRWTGIPVNKIAGSETDKLARLEDIMHQRLIGQEEAVSAVAQAVRRGRAGLKSAGRPIGSFIFMGPTGTGKTELAKTLADILFGSEDSMIRFDMTEYMEKHEVAKLLGAPPGYVGYEEGGKLTEAVRRKPYSVVLFDEVEKAHPDIFNILLQILDDGRLTDNKGHVVSFKNVVVICTSNLGSKIIQEELMKGGKAEIEEPPTITSYTFSPRGREIVTIGSKILEKEATGKWAEKMLLDYFAGQEVKPMPVKVIEGEVPPPPEKVELPMHGFDTHAMSSTGVEMITKAGEVFFKTSTTAKTWEHSNLITYFKEGVVINALPDAPDEQLPTAALKTHAFSPDEQEIVTYKDRYWRRKLNTNDWQTGFLRDYLVDQTAEKGQLPIAYWDIHTFSPSGVEVIAVGGTVWTKAQGEVQWKTKSINEYFGPDLPLDQHVEEKHKIDEEVYKKKFASLKEKVMNEMLKFFRPELVNRFDEVIMFEPLRFEHMTRIAKIQLKGVQKAMEDQDMGFAYTEAAIKEIARTGFDPVFGARPLRRAIQRIVENPISSLIIEKKANPGDEVVVDFDGQQFVFNIQKATLLEKKEQKQGKKYLCNLCAARFTTEVVPNATIICSSCGSSKVQEQFDIDAPVTPPVQKEEQKPPVETQLPKEQPLPTPDGLQPQK
ncbi:MAG: AAA family ATPase [Candidatus Roizmanbacteria bacterium]|nr:AAA family ATPase [Candidatus Roizmanbacteria bacterium]